MTEDDKALVERLLNLAAHILMMDSGSPDGQSIKSAADAIERLSRELDEARNAALEEAAGVADSFHLKWSYLSSLTFDIRESEKNEEGAVVARSVAIEIRALKGDA